MEITYLKNVKKRNKSTRRPTGGTTHTARLKAPTSVHDPVFILDVVDPDINYIIALGHYYYVVNVVILNNDMAEYHCKCDSLATHRSEILGSNQYVLRCASSDYHNTKVIDDSYPILTDPKIYTSSASPAFVTDGTAALIMSVKGKNGTSFWAIKRGLFGELGEALYDLAEDQTQAWTPINMPSGYDFIRTLLDPMDYITGARIIPIDANSLTGTSTNSIDIGYWNFQTDPTADFKKITAEICYRSAEYTLTLQSKSTGLKEFTNSNRYRSYELILPGVGSVTLDADQVLTGNNIKVKFIIDVSGMISYQIAYGAGNVYKTYINGDISIPFAIHGQTADYTKTIGTATNILGGGVAGGVSGAAMGGPVGAVAGALVGAAGATLNAVANAGPLYHTQSSGSDGSFARIDANKDIILKETIYDITITGETRLGAPCMRNCKIGDLSGYVLCKNASVSLSGYGDEKAEIESIMNSGFYVE